MTSKTVPLAVRWRWVVLTGWLLGLVAAAIAAPRLPEALQAGGFSSPDTESQRVADLLGERFGYFPGTVIVVFTSDFHRNDDPRFLAEMDRALDAVRQLKAVAWVTTPRQTPRQASRDGTTSYAVVGLRPGSSDRSRPLVRDVESALQPTELRTIVTGLPVFYDDIQTVTERDLRRAEAISLPLAAVALLLVFGSVVAAALPALVGGASVLVTLGAMALLSQITFLSIFALSLVTMLGFGLATDYSLFMVSRFREELRRGLEVQEALVRTLETAGRAILCSGAAVLVGLLALTSFSSQALRSLGLAGALVVVAAMLGALTLLPAVLSIIGRNIDRLRLRLPLGVQVRVVCEAAATPMAAAPSRRWGQLAHYVMAHPLRVLLPTLTFLLLLGAPFLQVRFGAPEPSMLPTDVPSRQGFDLLYEKFEAGTTAPLALLLEAEGDMLTPPHIGSMYDLAYRIALDPQVARVEGPLSLDPRLTREQYQLLYARPDRITDPYVAAAVEQFVRPGLVLFRVTPRSGPASVESNELVRRLRAMPPPTGMRTLVGGGAASVIDYTEGLYREFPRALAFMAATTFILLVALFRSLVLPLKAILVDALSITASFGALVAIFQEGLFAGPLGFHPTGYIEASLPILLFCLLFGLSMDYEVFLLSRVMEAYRESHDNIRSVAEGLQRSGGIITSAAAIIVLVAGSFVAADVVLIKAVGLGTAIAVLVDATIVRALLVPATMRLLGDWNWWAPRWLGRPAVFLLLAFFLLGGCQLTTSAPLPPTTTALHEAPDAARSYGPIRFPEDDLPHDVLTEWWYYTGHLWAASGRRYGFQFTVFQSVRQDHPIAYLAHFAVTDVAAGSFTYGARFTQRASIPAALVLEVGGWTLSAGDGGDRIEAALDGYTLDLVLAAEKPPILHQGGLVSFGPAGDSYYYSRTRLAVSGWLRAGENREAVTGQAWFDHQWGDFIVPPVGGWDWFSIQLDDHRELMLSVLRAPDGARSTAFGTFVDADGRFVDLPAEAFTVEALGSWQSPHTNALYPSGWRVLRRADDALQVPALELDLAALLPDQELAFPRLSYWEGAVTVLGTVDGEQVTGHGYVEPVGYRASP